ncbi:MAG: VOC family protein [Opitutaceae bacterium]|nr:VOC family protein [Opitutaceae bacterium]
MRPRSTPRWRRVWPRPSARPRRRPSHLYAGVCDCLNGPLEPAALHGRSRPAGHHRCVARTKRLGRDGAGGWLKDKYGMSWQITPTALLELLGSKDRAKAARVMQAMMQMTKIDIKK